MSLLKNGLFNTLLASSPLREKQQKTIRKKLNKKSSKNYEIGDFIDEKI